jgi:hypothetical protein
VKFECWLYKMNARCTDGTADGTYVWPAVQIVQLTTVQIARKYVPHGTAGSVLYGKWVIDARNIVFRRYYPLIVEVRHNVHVYRKLIGKTDIFKNIQFDWSLLKYAMLPPGRQNKFEFRLVQNTRWGGGDSLNLHRTCIYVFTLMPHTWASGNVLKYFCTITINVHF